jgi:hypothetical protein
MKTVDKRFQNIPKVYEKVIYEPPSNESVKKAWPKAKTEYCPE